MIYKEINHMILYILLINNFCNFPSCLMDIFHSLRIQHMCTFTIHMIYNKEFLAPRRPLAADKQLPEIPLPRSESHARHIDAPDAAAIRHPSASEHPPAAEDDSRSSRRFPCDRKSRRAGVLRPEFQRSRNPIRPRRKLHLHRIREPCGDERPHPCLRPLRRGHWLRGSAGMSIISGKGNVNDRRCRRCYLKKKQHQQASKYESETQHHKRRLSFNV